MAGLIKRMIMKAKWENDRPLIDLLNILYFNLFKINRFIVYEFDLSNNFTPPPLPGPNWEIKLIHFSDLERYIAGIKNMPREFYMHKIDNVENCVLILNGLKIAHISWIYIKGNKNRWFNLREDEVHFNYNYTCVGYRGNGLLSQALYATAAWAKKREYKRIVTAVHEETIFAIRGFDKVPEMKKVGILSQWSFCRPKYVF
jgi:hypothetical protein